MSLSLWSLALAATVIAVPLVIEVRRKTVDQRVMDDSHGQYADLPRGRVFFRWHGPKDGPVVVCIHGLSTPSYVWDGLIPHLVDRGFRVLSYDLYGRGHSDRPFGAQDVTFFEEMLTALLHDQNVTTPVTLIGNSMGSAISTAFAARHPSRVRQVVLFVPAGMGHDLGLSARITQKIPVIGDWLFHLAYPRTLHKGAMQESDLPSSVPNITDRQVIELGYRGFLRSLMSSLRGALSETREEDHRKLQDLGMSVLAIWGRRDDIIPIACKARLTNWNRDVTHIELPDAGHGLVYTHTSEFWPLLEPALLAD